jgi:hypothetical protein
MWYHRCVYIHRVIPKHPSVVKPFIETIELLHVLETKNNIKAVGDTSARMGRLKVKMTISTPFKSPEERYGLQLDA